jgi:hypothetical protein
MGRLPAAARSFSGAPDLPNLCGMCNNFLIIALNYVIHKIYIKIKKNEMFLNFS